MALLPNMAKASRCDLIGEIGVPGLISTFRCSRETTATGHSNRTTISQPICTISSYCSPNAHPFTDAARRQPPVALRSQRSPLLCCKFSRLVLAPIRNPQRYDYTGKQID